MKFKILFHISLIFFLTLHACRSDEVRQQPEDMGIRLSPDSSALELYNVPDHITEQLSADSLNSEQWKNFFACYPEPADSDLRDFQHPLDGSYMVRDSVFSFIPADTLAKGQAYFARCYTRQLLRKPQDIIAKRKLSSSEGFIEYRFSLHK